MSDSKPARPNAAAIVSGHSPPRQRDSKERAGKRRGIFDFKRNAAESKGASRHHDCAATGKLGRSYRCEKTKVLSRFSTQNRRDQTRQQSSAGTARRFSTQNRRDQTRQQSSASTARRNNAIRRNARGNVAVYSISKEMPQKARAQAVTTTAQRPESWEERISARQQRF